MIKEINGTTLEFNCKLGTTMVIKKTFNKPFNQVLQELDKMDIEELIKLLYCGIKDKMEYKDFSDLIYDNVGVMELYELVQSFIKQLQYPGLTEDEIDKKLEEKNLQAQKLQNLTSLSK